MTSSRASHGVTGDLAQDVARWKRMDEENRELKDRIASALGEVNGFIAERRADLEKRKGKLLQTSGFRDETKAMEAALDAIGQMLAGGRNISRLFAEIDKYLAAYKVDDTLSRLHTRIQLADARDEFMCAFHDSVRGTKLAELLDILYFMPFAYWRSRGLERRNYRSPSAAEILGLLAELRRRKIDYNRLDTVQLAAVIRIQLGITPRMDYHHLAANKLAERLTDAETLTRLTAKVTPLDEGFCRAAEGILVNIRRWSAELFAGANLSTPAEIEAEMLQIVFLAGETISISGTGLERSTDYLWLLATVVASDHATLKETLSWPGVRDNGHPSVHERMLGTKSYLDTVAVLADRVLAARWQEAREALTALARRSEAISAQQTHDIGEFTELEQLKDKRSELGKSLIKISDALQLFEPVIHDALTSAAGPSDRPAVDEHLRTLDPGKLIDRNRSYAEETRQVARQELEKLRAMIGRIAEISRKGFAGSTAQEEADRSRTKDRSARLTSDGVAVGDVPTAEVQALLVAALRKALASVQDSWSRIAGARKRAMKSDLLHGLNVLGDKLRKAVEVGGAAVADLVDPNQAPGAAGTVAQVLRDVLAAQTNLNARLNNAKLTPAEKQVLTSVLFAVKAKLSDDLRDVESLRAELAERTAETVTGAPGTAGQEAPSARMAGLAAAANQALGPVKERLTALAATIADRTRDAATILAATRGLKSALDGARALMSENRARVEAIAATCAVDCAAFSEKFDRWQRQVEAVDAEAARLLRATECIAAMEQSVRIATGVEEGTTGRAGDAPAHETLAHSLERLREAREACAAAAKAEWRILKGAAAYLLSREAGLDACEAALKERRSRIDGTAAGPLLDVPG